MTAEESTFKHEWEFEQDTGFIVARTNGVIAGPDAVKYIELYKRDVPPGEAGFMLCDNRNATGNSPEARKIFAKEWDPGEVYLAVFGSSFSYHALTNLFLAGLKLMRPLITGKSFGSESEARAWLTEQRNAYRARRAKAS
ncbi:MAG TPA: hypothetical protein VM580_09565 [Labilithrix sp.]|nr:hypothetical protein [Labilithrix sp.]